MAAGDIRVIGPYLLNDNDTISGALRTNAPVVADDITAWAQDGQVWFAIVKAA